MSKNTHVTRRKPIRRAPGLILATAGLGFLACVVSASAQTVVGTVTVCYYSPECGFATVPGHTHGPNAEQRARDKGEHPGTHRVTGSYAPVDAPAFEFTNAGSEAITGARFEILENTKLGIAGDVFKIGKIRPGASFTIIPGLSNDKMTHPAGGFFVYTDDALDTSDSGPDANQIKFIFYGKVGTTDVSSGKISVGASVAPSTDHSVSAINFLGGPGNADGPCDDCVAPKVIAQISTETSD